MARIGLFQPCRHHTMPLTDLKIRSLKPDGKPRRYTDGRTLAQLEWWAAAAHAHTTTYGIPNAAPVLNRDPSQRNTP